MADYFKWHFAMWLYECIIESDPDNHYHGDQREWWINLPDDRVPTSITYKVYYYCRFYLEEDHQYHDDDRRGQEGLHDFPRGLQQQKQLFTAKKYGGQLTWDLVYGKYLFTDPKLLFFCVVKISALWWLFTMASRCKYW